MKTVHQWLDEYAQSHQNRANKLIHWFCVPLIVFATLGLLWGVPFPGLGRVPCANAATVVVLLALLYYARLSLALAAGIALAAAGMSLALAGLERAAWAPVWQISLAVLIAAWAGQFVGHGIEGKRPSFLKDLQFLLIGPLWVLSALYRRLGIRYG